ncbi:Thioredoxin reductase 2 [Gracilariopsis chorda]|uniref:Thioredoxin reductase n=1 Tax=Gracilariopsis chorda TaxID=448386 RepID=A0A2V3J4Y3_9FLOR|nr:Thioredoxin reductase 2 [Gracilariopsis chorda]|eukprot:PXF49057.1 Thioredoxin reductase 2 [Gracilariopsis chorda]
MVEDANIENVVIIGSGPAAHTAAIYLSRAELKPLMYEGFLAAGVAAGGQLTTTTDVENFPGFPDGIGGMEITDRFRKQSVRFGTRILTETVTSVDLSSRPFQITGEGTNARANTIVVATGATARRLDIKGCRDGEYWQRGISACAVCDGAAPIFRGAVLAVVGGGDSAMEEAIFLTKFGSKVIIIHRRDALRASKIMQRRAMSNPKIEFLYSHVVEEAKGDGNLLKSLVVKDLKTNSTSEIDCAGLFFAIGHEPNVKFLRGQVEMDEQSYIITKPDSTATSVKGVFAAGDVQDKKWRQAVTAAGTGCMAALEIEEYLESLGEEEVSENVVVEV